jgi:hypothetical protein
MVPNPFLAKVIAKVLSSLAKSTIKAYSTTIKSNAISFKQAWIFQQALTWGWSGHFDDWDCLERKQWNEWKEIV